MNNPWKAWRNYVTGILEGEGRLLTDDEREHAEELVKGAKQAERRERRKAKRLAAGGTWHE